MHEHRGREFDLLVLASPITLMVLIALIVWWRLPVGGAAERHGQGTAVD